MSTLDLIADKIPVKDIPEVIVGYLAGDDCLDHCETLEAVFCKEYRKNYQTFMDEECTVLHSFNDKPCIRIEQILYYSRHQTRFPYNVYQEWYRNGKLHRENDKPACIHRQMTETELTDKILLETELDEKHAIVSWYRYGRLHRDHGKPAHINSFVSNWRNKKPSTILKEWWVDGKRHREGKPAVTLGSRAQWFFNGKHIRTVNNNKFKGGRNRRERLKINERLAPERYSIENE